MWAVRGGGVTAYVGTSLEDEREVIFELTRSLAIGLPLLVALFVAGIWLMVGRTLRPVEDIRAEVAVDLASPAGPTGADSDRPTTRSVGWPGR